MRVSFRRVDSHVARSRTAVIDTTRFVAGTPWMHQGPPAMEIRGGACILVMVLCESGVTSSHTSVTRLPVRREEWVHRDRRLLRVECPGSVLPVAQRHDCVKGADATFLGCFLQHGLRFGCSIAEQEASCRGANVRAGMLQQYGKGFPTRIPMLPELLKRRDVLLGVAIAGPGISAPDGVGLGRDIPRELLDQFFQRHHQSPFFTFSMASNPNSR